MESKVIELFPGNETPAERPEIKYQVSTQVVPPSLGNQVHAPKPCPVCRSKNYVSSFLVEGKAFAGCHKCDIQAPLEKWRKLPGCNYNLLADRLFKHGFGFARSGTLADQHDGYVVMQANELSELGVSLILMATSLRGDL